MNILCDVSLTYKSDIDACDGVIMLRKVNCMLYNTDKRIYCVVVASKMHQRHTYQQRTSILLIFSPWKNIQMFNGIFFLSLKDCNTINQPTNHCTTHTHT